MQKQRRAGASEFKKTVYRAPANARSRTAAYNADSVSVTDTGEQNEPLTTDKSPSRFAPEGRGVAMLGAVVLLFSVIGLASVIIFGVKSAVGFFSDKRQEEAERLQQLIAPLVMCDPAPFENVSALDNESLVRTCVWVALTQQADDLKTDDAGRLILPGQAVTASCESLFGTQVSPALCSFSDDGVEFEYDIIGDMYHIPITGLGNAYEPRITDIEKKKDTLILTVDYIKEDYYGSGEKSKTMKYILSGDSGKEKIVSVLGTAAG